MALFTLPPGGWPVILAVSVAVGILHVLYQSRKYPRTPGPLLARFTGLWHAYTLAQGKFHEDNVELHRKYGKIVRLAPKYYSFDDPAALKTIYGHGTRFAKSSWYDIWDGPRSGLDSPATLFGERDIRTHAEGRRQYSSLYAMSSLVGYEPNVDNCIEILINKLSELSQGGTNEIPMTSWFQWYAFDVIGEMTFSKRLGFMETASDVGGLIHLITLLFRTNFVIGFFPTLVTLRLWAFKLMGEQEASRLDKFAKARIQEAKQSLIHGYDEADPREREAAAPDFCARIIALGESDRSDSEKRPKVLDVDFVSQQASRMNIGAGSDTTSVTLTATLHNILFQPAIYQRLREEVDEAYARGALSDPPTFAESQELPYLQAIVKEALRIHPATGLPLWREVPVGGATICGVYFPAGTNVGINSWVAHRNRDVWGEDADDFRPERWLDSSPEKLKEMNAYFMAFGAGSRTCIGKNISLLEISKVIPQLVRKFDITLTRAAAVKALPAHDAWFVSQKHFSVYMRPREGVDVVSSATE